MALNLDKATRDEIYEEAKRLEIPGRSGMTKPALIEAITKARLDENNTRDQADLDRHVRDTLPVDSPERAPRPTIEDVLGTPSRPAGKAVPSTVGARVEDVKLPADIARLFDTSRPVTTNRMTRALRARNSKYRGMQSRGLGAKHYPSRNNPVPTPMPTWGIAPGRSNVYKLIGVPSR